MRPSGFLEWSVQDSRGPVCGDGQVPEVLGWERTWERARAKPGLAGAAWSPGQWPGAKVVVRGSHGSSCCGRAESPSWKAWIFHNLEVWKRPNHACSS